MRWNRPLTQISRRAALVLGLGLVGALAGAQSSGSGKIIEYRGGEPKVRSSELAGNAKPQSASDQAASQSSPPAAGAKAPSASVELIVGGSSKDGSAKVTRLPKADRR